MMDPGHDYRTQYRRSSGWDEQNFSNLKRTPPIPKVKPPLNNVTEFVELMRVNFPHVTLTYCFNSNTFQDGHANDLFKLWKLMNNINK